MKTLKTLASVAIAATIVPLVAGVAEAALIKTIDPLSNFQLADQTAVTSTGISSQLLGGVSRSLDVDAVKQPSTSPFPLSSQVAIAGGELAFSNGVGTNGIVTVDYGTFAPVDFTMGGADSIIVGLTSADLAGTTIKVTINGISVTQGPVGVAPPVMDLEFDFDAFTGLDETAVTSFNIMIDPVTAGDVTINLLGTSGTPTPPTTPEPATMLGLLAVAGFGASALKKKNAKL
ncbi:PEP-CTERM sorting domain-containing protein [Chroococcus sp. FPU101]|uniref:PEP-CTERM sorting domain-containing protein n=1 Tax=Chroococcus sp. FPU101 TaxID=1974212 RepID=UPI001A8E1AF1|nr:PEP-CTERM sorting domain-containing protein [Chroococcus sp. FPU101]GFE70001.1 hypothetical protein CFPU101_26110 [Chroococcus sp. FPU101]